MANTTSLASIDVLFKLKARMLNTNAGVTKTARWSELGKLFSPAVTMTSGTTADKADQLLYVESNVLTSGSSTSLDMYAGNGWDGENSNFDLFGNALTLAEITSLLIWSDAVSAGNLIIGYDTSPITSAWQAPFAGSVDPDDAAVTIFPDGVFALHGASPANAYVVTNTTSHLLQLTASGGNVTYSAIALGRSA